MPGSGYSVEFIMAQDLLADMMTVTSSIQTLVVDLDNSVARTLNVANWDSGAREQWAVCQQQWDNAAGQMHVQLGNATRAIETIFENYRRTDQSIAGMWRQYAG